MLAEFNRPHVTLMLAKAALTQIEALQLPADPCSFELFYVYAAGHNALLNQAINQILDEAGTLNERDVDRLHAQYLSPKRLVSQLDLAANQLAGELTAITQNLNEASETSKSYRSKLDVGLVSLDSNPPIAKLATVVNALVSATRDIEAKNRSFEARLEESKIKTEQLRAAVKQLRSDISQDSLTQLGNRRYLDETLSHMAQIAQERGLPLTLIMADIDHFKLFNDTFGHPVGDEVLRLVASTIKSVLRDVDIACRYGGEEFAVILPNVEMEEGRIAAERLRETISAKRIKKRSTGQVLGQVTMSIGVVQLREREEPAEFLERADECMYAAKRAGRNRVICETEVSKA